MNSNRDTENGKCFYCGKGNLPTIHDPEIDIEVVAAHIDREGNHCEGNFSVPQEIQ